MGRAAQALLTEENSFFLSMKNPEADFMSDAEGRARFHRGPFAHFVLCLETQSHLGWRRPLR